MATGKYSTAIRPEHPCTRHDSNCPPAVVPTRPVHRRALRGLTVVAVAVLAAWVTGQLMLASHLPDDTRYGVAAGIVAVVVLAGIGVIARSHPRGRASR